MYYLNFSQKNKLENPSPNCMNIQYNIKLELEGKKRGTGVRNNMKESIRQQEGGKSRFNA